MNYKEGTQILKAIKEMLNKIPTPYDKQAKVVRKDGNTLYVHINGGVPETPAEKTIDAEVGDIVRVRVSGGKASLTGNITHPPTGDQKAVEAEKKAEKALEKAETAEAVAEEGSQIWTATGAPTSPNYTFALSDLTGPEGVTPRQGDLIFYSYYRYTIQTVGGTSVLAGDRVSIQGPTGASIASVVNYYVLSATTTAPDYADFTTTYVTPTENEPYLWYYAKFTYTDSTSTNTARQILMTYTAGIEGKGISSITYYYCKSSSTTPPADSSFVTSPIPQIDSVNKYLWSYSVISYTDGSTPTTTSKAIIGTYGDKGDTGSQGVSVASVTNYYLATSASSGVTPSTAGWTTTIQTMTSTNQYLWTYEVVTGSDSSTLNTTDPIIIGRYGQNGQTGAAGKGISSITEYYLASASSSGVTRSTSGWTTTLQTTDTTKKYLWNYEKLTYTDSSNSYVEPRIIGTHGATGSTGSTGPQGVSVTMVQAQYYLSTSSSSATGGSWSDTPQTFVHGKYYWTRDKITFSDNTTGYSTGVYNKGLTDANETAYAAKTQAEGINQYFWNKSTGGTTAVPTGSYVTEVDKTTFESTPQGGNLLLQSTAVKLRVADKVLAELTGTGLTFKDSNGDTLASFGSTVVLGKTSLPYVKLNSNGLEFFDSSNRSGGSIKSYYNNMALLYIDAVRCNFTGNVVVMGYANVHQLYVDDVQVVDHVIEKGRTRINSSNPYWYYEKWSSGRIEAWSDSVSTGTLTMSRHNSMLYRATGVDITMPSGIFSSTPTSAMVSIPYSSAVAVNALVMCSSATKLSCQIWKNSNATDAVNLKFHVVYYPSTY